VSLGKRAYKGTYKPFVIQDMNIKGDLNTFFDATFHIVDGNDPSLKTVCTSPRFVQFTPTTATSCKCDKPGWDATIVVPKAGSVDDFVLRVQEKKKGVTLHAYKRLKVGEDVFYWGFMFDSHRELRYAVEMELDAIIST
jgi:hypothetical protein